MNEVRGEMKRLIGKQCLDGWWTIFESYEAIWVGRILQFGFHSKIDFKEHLDLNFDVIWS